MHRDTVVRRYRKALMKIADYGDLPGGGGCCDYGCDTPTIAQQALMNEGAISITMEEENKLLREGIRDVIEINLRGYSDKQYGKGKLKELLNDCGN